MFTGYEKQVDQLQTQRLETLQKVEQQHSVLSQLEMDYQSAFDEFKQRRDAKGQRGGKLEDDLGKCIHLKKNSNEKLKIKLNEYGADIKQQREKINAMRKERTLLDKMYSKLETSIKKKMDSLYKLIQKTEEAKKNKLDLVDEMMYLESSAKEGVSSFEENYNEAIRKMTQNISMGQMSGSEDGEFDQEVEGQINNSVFDSQVIEERDATKGEVNGEEESSEEDIELARLKSQYEDPREQELSELKRLFSKLQLLTELKDFTEIKEYYDNGDENNEKIYNDIIAMEQKYEEVLQDQKVAQEELDSLKKKETTLQELIDEDKVGYNIAVTPFSFNFLGLDSQIINKKREYDR